MRVDVIWKREAWEYAEILQSCQKECEVTCLYLEFGAGAAHINTGRLVPHLKLRALPGQHSERQTHFNQTLHEQC